MKRKKYYDPDPGRRRKRHRGKGPRKGVEPPGLKRWRLSHRGRSRRTHDPGYSYSMRTGPRGGHYFIGPKKRRYDPNRFARLRAYGRRHPRLAGYAGKVEHALGGGWGTGLGALIGLLAGIWTGWQEYGSAYGFGGKYQGSNYLNTIIGGEIKDNTGAVLEKKGPEIAHLWNFDMNSPQNALWYLKYKFLGLDDKNAYVGSAWVIPFWASIISYIFSRLPLGTKLKRIQRPVGALAKGGAIISTIGALALPGSPNGGAYSNIPSALPGYNNPEGKQLY
jgi:hypothetical protein